MASINPRVYSSILRVRKAYPFDVACVLMRFYTYMMSIGTVSMLSLAGYSFLESGLTASAIAFSIFLISPRISKKVDEYGQSKIVPKASAVVIIGLCGLLACVCFNGPVWVMFFAAILMGCIPNPQAMARARWTYLLRTKKLGDNAPDIRTIFSYEGVLDDVAFMVSPPFAIAMAAAVAPIAGLAIGGICFVIGSFVLSLSKSTEPVPGWVADEEDASNSEDYASNNSDNLDQLSNVGSSNSKKTRSIILESSVVRVLFLLMFLTGCFYGVFDSSGVAFAEELGDPNIAGTALMVSAIISAFVGFIFGMVRISAKQSTQQIVTSVFMGLIYGLMALIDSALSFFVISCIAALSYAPFLITSNATCERAVPGRRLTEAITWINSGMTCGIAIGPTIAGIIVDYFGSMVGFDVGALFALAIPVITLIFSRMLRKKIECS